MGFWLVKSEPAKYAFADLERDGSTVWDGVRNNQAALCLKAAKAGDQVLYYHSQEGLAVVGVAEVSKEAFLDPSDPRRPLRGGGAEAGASAAQAGDLGRDEGQSRPGRHGHVPPVPPRRSARSRRSEWATILKMAGEGWTPPLQPKNSDLAPLAAPPAGALNAGNESGRGSCGSSAHS